MFVASAPAIPPCLQTGHGIQVLDFGHRDARAELMLTDAICRQALGPAQKCATNFILYSCVVRTYSASWLGHGYGYAWYSPIQVELIARVSRACQWG